MVDQAGQGSDLEGIAGHGAHEHGELLLLAQTAAGSKVAPLVEGQRITFVLFSEMYIVNRSVKYLTIYIYFQHVNYKKYTSK